MEPLQTIVPSVLSALERDGHALRPGVLTPAKCDAWIERWEAFIAAKPDATVLRTAAGAVYGARNLLREWPAIVGLGRHPALLEIVRVVLGPDAGLVRVLFFDKPPEQSWALPWHKDLAIAVKDNRLGGQFKRPTMKHGVPHVEATAAVLERMLTARLHLDAATADNGPLQVISGSHREATREVTTILAEAGDAFFMRPLLSHASGDSLPGTDQHRRLFHFEYAADAALPDGYQWFDFVPLEG